METIQKRQKLHEYIDTADDEKVNALFVILESDSNSYQYSAEEISTFYKRRERYLKGEGKSFSVKEAFDQMCKSTTLH